MDIFKNYISESNVKRLNITVNLGIIAAIIVNLIDSHCHQKL